MKRKALNFSLLACASLLAFSTASCSSSSSSQTEAKIQISASVIRMNSGETKQLTVSVDKGHMNTPVRWFTSNENVAYFRNPNSGFVTALGEGTATVTAAMGGAYADCTIIVENVNVDPDAKVFSLTPVASLTVGQTIKLSYSASPISSTVTFTSSNPAVCSVDATGMITGEGEGSATITGECSNGITKTCDVTVTASSVDPEDPTDLDIYVGRNLGLTGDIVVGRPIKSAGVVKALCDSFNTLTGSSVNFSYKDFEDGDGVANFPSGAASGPDIFPFVSDQTMNLNNIGALAPVSRNVYSDYKYSMLDGAVDACTWNQSVKGYPFAADNGVVMFYDKSVITDPSEISTLSGLYNACTSRGDDWHFNYNLTNGFYAASALHTYSGGESYFTITPKTTSYTCSSNFKCEKGQDALLLASSIMGQDFWSSAVTEAPGEGNNQAIATIVDTSNVREFKERMGDKYAVAPVPYIDDEKTTRLCTYLGYKFYGVNNSIVDTNKKNVCHIICQFLTSEYAQNYRYSVEKTQPTLKTLQSICANEPHIAALNAQKESGSTLLLSVFGDEYFNNTSKTLTTVLNKYVAVGTPLTRSVALALLTELDESWGA